MTYEIRNSISGVVFGNYEASSIEAALEVFARDAGYASYAGACEAAPAADGEIVVIEVAA